MRELCHANKLTNWEFVTQALVIVTSDEFVTKEDVICDILFDKGRLCHANKLLFMKYCPKSEDFFT